MPKGLTVKPEDVRRSRTLAIAPIPVNQYDTPLAVEEERLGKDRLVAVLRDMILIREVETALDGLKQGAGYRGFAYVYRGPAHLSIGQEAAAVGQAFALGPDDHIFGSHRSHAEILAKSLSAIRKMADSALQDVMESYFEGRILRAVEAHFPADDVKTRAEQFVLYGLFAEIFGRATGFNCGLGGSMHAFFRPFGVYPNNAIVGASAPIAAGAALFKKARKQPGLVIANIGDGATGSGPVWEALNFASMSQLRLLWDQPYRGGLAVIFFFVNNFYAMGGQTIGETMGYEQLSRIGAGVNPFNMHAETIDGNTPLAVADAIERARRWIAAGEGPVLLDCLCYRQSGHSSSDASSYRTREEIGAWRSVDPLSEYARQLDEAHLLDSAGAAALANEAGTLVADAARLAADEASSPRIAVEEMGHFMFSNEETDLSRAPRGQMMAPLETSPRWIELGRRARRGVEGGRPLPASRAIQIRDALFEAIAYHASRDDRLIIYGQENRDWGGAFGVYRGLTELLPYHRFFNAPISEAAIVGSAVGYAMEGGRALVEIMYADFMGRCGDELFNQLAKWRAMSGGVLDLPIVVRISVGRTYGAQHSQDWSSLPAHIPGLKVVYPATPYDAKGLMASALSQNDPVVFFESQRLYGQVEIFQPDGVPAEYYRVPIGQPSLVREGGDLTILTIGPALYPAAEAASRLEGEFGLGVDLIDARSLVPLDYAPIVRSVEKTGRLLLASDACERGSYLNTIAANVQRFAFGHLDAPIAIVGAWNWITPSADLEEDFFVSPARLLDAVHAAFVPLPGYTPTRERPIAHLMQRAASGI